MKRFLLGSVLVAGSWIGSSAWAIGPGQTGELPQAGEWSGTNWSWSTTGVHAWYSPGNGNAFIGSAVAIGPNHLLTAGHVGGNPNEYTLIDGVKYTAVESYLPPHDPGRSGPPDLRVIQVDKTLPVYNTLYGGSLASGMKVTLIGYGQDGQDLDFASVQPIAGTEGIGRWGTNTVNRPGLRSSNGNSQLFDMAYFRTNTPYEAMAAQGDSGGGVFIKVDDTWQLAGIISSISPQHTHTFAVSLPDYRDWIQSIAVIPEPGVLWALPGLCLLMRRRGRELS